MIENKVLLEADMPVGDEETRNDSYSEWVKEWPSADDKRREVICREILQQLGTNSSERQNLLNFIDSFRHSCYEYGIEPEVNPFIYYIQALAKNIKASDKEDSYVNILVELVSSGEVNKDAISKAAHDKNSFLMNPSLFYRNESDFEYTVKVWDILTTPRVKQFIKDPSVINMDQLYVNNKGDGKIKPAGDDATSLDKDSEGIPTTIFGMVELWSEGNEVDDGKKSYNGKPRKYTRSELEHIKKEKLFNDLSQVPEEEKFQGNVIYVEFMGDMVKNQIDPNNWVDTWMIYDNGKWAKYEP